MRILITGISGFVGSHLAEHILKMGHEVFGIVRWRSKMENISHIQDKLHLLNADIKDGYSLQNVFRSVSPDVCFHLAAQSFVKESWNSPIETLNINVLGTGNVLEAIRLSCHECVTCVAGSSEEYGLVHPSETPIKETNPLRPMSPYGVSKVATDMLGLLSNKSYGMKTIVTRCFNTTGPRRGDVFATSSFAKQIAEIEVLGKPKVLYVGNLDARRDWTDVRDIAKAYWLAAMKCKPGEVYNICRGGTWTVREMLDMLLGMSNEKIEVKQDADRLRPSDVPLLLGSADKFKVITDWQPVVPFEKTMTDLLNYWREKAGK